MTLRDWFSLEWKLTLGRPSSRALFALFAVLLIYAATNGKSHLDSRLEAIDQHQTEVSQTMSTWLNNLELKESGADPAEISPRTGSAMDVRFSSWLPHAPLADFAIGQSDILPYLSTISLATPDIRIFSRYEFEDPVSLMLGGFDLSTAIIVLLPLLLIVVCFDLVSADRDANRLGLTLSQGISISSLFWNRLLLRSAAVLAVLTVITAIMLFAQTGSSALSERLIPFLIWTAGTLVYAAFWVAVIALIAAMNRRSEFNIMALLSIWLGFVFIVPSGASAILETVYPTPTRLSYLAEARETENEARLQEADLANQFILDHPEMLVNEAAEVPAFLRSNFLVNRTIDEATRPILEEFDAAARQRESSVGIIRYLSPAIIAQGLFNDLAGTSAARHQRYVQQVREFKANYAEQVGPGVVAGQALTTTDFASLETFNFRDQPISQVLLRHLMPLMFLILLTIAAVTLVNRRLAAFSVVGKGN